MLRRKRSYCRDIKSIARYKKQIVERFFKGDVKKWKVKRIMK